MYKVIGMVVGVCVDFGKDVVVGFKSWVGEGVCDCEFGCLGECGWGVGVGECGMVFFIG